MAGIATNGGSIFRKVNDSIVLTTTLTKNGLPVTGKTPRVALVRRSDGKFYDFTLNSWQVPVFLEPLVESIVAPGVYEAVFNQFLADPNSQEDYLAIYSMTPGVPADYFYVSEEISFRTIAAPGDAMTLSTATIQAIRAEIMSYVVNANPLGYTFEQTTDLVRKLLNNRLELSDGLAGNWILYDDDDLSVLLTYDVTSKTGTAIQISSSAPARRTRGA
jgi:hypothetical protein